MKPRVWFVLFFALAMALPAWSNTLDVVRRLDLAETLGPVADGYQIPALAHDGKDLWLVDPAGGHLLQVETNQGALVGRHKIAGYGPVVPAGMTYGADHLWLLDAGGRALLQVDRKGKVKNITPLGPGLGQPFGIDFLPGGEGRPATLLLAVRGPGDLPPGLIGFVFKGGGLVAGSRDPLPLQGATALTTTLIGGEPYTWISAPRSNEDPLESPGSDSGAGAFPFAAAPLPPDDAIPRGGMDRASSHRIGLTDPKRGAVIGEAYLPGPAERDLAADGNDLFVPIGTIVAVSTLIEEISVELGACVYRELEFFYIQNYNHFETIDFSFAAPYDSAFGPPDPALYTDGTGGYRNQEVLEWQLIEPVVDGVRYSEYTHIGGQWLVRQGVHFLGLSGFNPSARYRILGKVCAAKHNVVPSMVSGSWAIPDAVALMYSYDGDGDGYGDDNPATCVDDFYGMDEAAIHRHLVDSGAMSETNLYYRARAIHEYVTTRHAYSGADKHWSNPECNPSQKLDSPYATCSSSAFMVAALMREAGIPARMVGTSIQRASDLLPGQSAVDDEFHRWAQIYLPPYGWVRVDSTPADPGTLGMRDVNADLKYNECDLCITDTQCQNDYNLSFARCNIQTPFTNPNDTDGDGDVDGDDIESLGGTYWTAARLDAKFHPGVRARDLITTVAVGLPSLYLERNYIAAPVDHIGSELTCNTTVNYGEDGITEVRWTNPAIIIGVFVSFDPSARGPASVHWQTQGPFDQGDLVRLDLYQRFSSQNGVRYKHLRELAHDVPAFFTHREVDLGSLPDQGDFVVAVTRQGGPFRDRFSALPQADWETFGVSQSLPLK